MKTLKKLIIKPEKVIKNEELVNLKGGYTGDGCCYCAGHGFLLTIPDESNCVYECYNLWHVMGFWTC